jgi:hypothetical protein
VQPPDVLPPKRPLTKDPPFWLDDKRKDCLLKFPAVRSDSSPIRRCRICLKTKKVVKLDGIVESMVFLYILGNVIPDTTLSESTKRSPKCVQSFRFLYIIVCE